MQEVNRKSIIHTNTQVSRSQLIRFFRIYNNLDSFKNRVKIMLGVFINLGIDRENLKKIFLGHFEKIPNFNFRPKNECGPATPLSLTEYA